MDHTLTDPPQSPECPHCTRNCPDTLAHATLECTHASLMQPRAALMAHITNLGQQDAFWETTIGEDPDSLRIALLQAPGSQEEQLEQETLHLWTLLTPVLRQVQALRGQDDF